MKRVIICAFIFVLLNINAINQYPLDTLYHRWENIDDTLLVYHNFDKKDSKIEILGITETLQLPIYMYSLVKDNNNKKKNILIIGQYHGEEPLGVEIAFNIISELSRNKSNISLLETYNFYIIPTINPEGMKIVNSGVYPLQRKNCKDTNENGVYDFQIDGVDLNKNYPINWNNEDLKDSTGQYYRGKYPVSEKETQAIVNLSKRIKFDYAFFYHSSSRGTYDEIIFFPYWWDRENKSSDWDILYKEALLLSSNIPKLMTGLPYTVHNNYTSRYGFARDFFYTTYGTKCFNIEVGTITSNGQVIFMPKNKIMKKIVKSNSNGLLKFLHLNK